MLRKLLAGGYSAIAGRLAGAFRRIGKGRIADEIISVMKSADYAVRETDPFKENRHFAAIASTTAPIVVRLQALWASHRETVLEVFPPAPGLPRNPAAYLKVVDEVYTSDAYHSLSIEGYRVSPELIERVRAGDWSPDQIDGDRTERNALAARGYWQAFQAVIPALRCRRLDRCRSIGQLSQRCRLSTETQSMCPRAGKPCAT